MANKNLKSNSVLESEFLDTRTKNVLVSLAAGASEVANLYSLEYISNGGSNIPTNQSVSSENTSYSFTIPSDVIPTRAGYSFRGWSTSSSDTEGSTAYEPGKSFTVANTAPDIKLYAIWKKLDNQLASLGTMQKMTSTACTNTTTPTKWDTISGVPEAQLTDTRDGKTYWVAKLADGNCWMTQNLALDLKGKTLTTSDSDVTSNWSGASNVDSGLWTGSSSDYNTIKWYHSDVGTGHSSYGNLYSWGAATAGKASSLTSSSSTGWPEASGSICPNGWRLPFSNSTTKDKSFGKLTTTYGISNNTAGSTTLRSAPLYFVYGGLVNNGSLSSAGSHGYYWSSTADDASYAYNLFFNSGGVYPSSNYYYRYYGFSVRCVAR